MLVLFYGLEVNLVLKGRVKVFVCDFEAVIEIFTEHTNEKGVLRTVLLKTKKKPAKGKGNSLAPRKALTKS